MNQIDIAALASALQDLQRTDPATSRVSSASVKLPPFWTAQPDVWFSQVEAQFATRSPAIVADLTKYNYVAASLDTAVAAEVRALLLHPPATGKYDALKAALTEAFGRSQAQNDAALLSLNGLGDRSPTALLRHILGLNADPNTLIKAIFLAQMPVEVRRVLATSKTTSLAELAGEADRVVDACNANPPHLHVAAATAPSSRRTPYVHRDPTVCYFHDRYGTKARNCKREGCRLAHLVPATRPAVNSSAPGNDRADCL